MCFVLGEGELEKKPKLWSLVWPPICDSLVLASQVLGLYTLLKSASYDHRATGQYCCWLLNRGNRIDINTINKKENEENLPFWNIK